MELKLISITSFFNNKFAKYVAPVSSIDELYETTCFPTGRMNVHIHFLLIYYSTKHRKANATLKREQNPEAARAALLLAIRME